jgi:hypothetical protein
MLSHPTPPVSLFEARQLSIMFSQMADSSCFAAIPRRTNSMTACEDWQSQIPIEQRSEIMCFEESCVYMLLTVTGEHNKFVIVREVVDSHVGVGGDNLLLWGKIGALLELKVTDGTGKGEVAVDTTKVDKTTSGANSGLLTYSEVSKV